MKLYIDPKEAVALSKFMDGYMASQAVNIYIAHFINSKRNGIELELAAKKAIAATFNAGMIEGIRLERKKKKIN